jgi:hypothetical protein
MLGPLDYARAALFNYVQGPLLQVIRCAARGLVRFCVHFGVQPANKRRDARRSLQRAPRYLLHKAHDQTKHNQTQPSMSNRS